MYPASLLEATLTLLLLLVALHCYKLVTAAQNALHAIHAEDQNPLMPLDAGVPLEQPVQETGAPIGHGLFQARTTVGDSYPGVRPVQETQQAFLIEDALQQSVGGLGTAQESLYQRNLPAAMVAGLRI